MQNERYKILSDLEEIENVLKRIHLQDERVRCELARLLCNKNIFRHKIGERFIYSLEQEDWYNEVEYQREVLKDCQHLREILYSFDQSDMKNVEHLRYWEVVLHGKHERIFQTWMNKVAEQCILSCIEEAKVSAYERENEKQNHDMQVIRELSKKYRFDHEDDAQALYEFLIGYGKPVFLSKIGYDFMKELQENTYSYKQSKTMGRRFRWAGIICCCVACIAAVFVGAMELQEYRREVDKQWIGKIKELEESVESATLSETEGTKEEEKKPEVGVLPDILKQYKTLHTLNEDLCGWLSVPGLGINLPVMQNHEDEDFYLDHDFNRKEDKNGELFLDPKVSLWPQSENMVIYGHNVSSGDMFGLLDQYADKGFYQKFPTFSFDTLYERATYEIVAVVKTQILNEGEEGFRYYSCFDFETEEKMDVFRAWVKKNQLYETGQRFENGDSFVMLSTCEYSVEQGRFVVIGKKMEK